MNIPVHLPVFVAPPLDVTTQADRIATAQDLRRQIQRLERVPGHTLTRRGLSELKHQLAGARGLLAVAEREINRVVAKVQS